MSALGQHIVKEGGRETFGAVDSRNQAVPLGGVVLLGTVKPGRRLALTGSMHNTGGFLHSCLRNEQCRPSADEKRINRRAQKTERNERRGPNRKSAQFSPPWVKAGVMENPSERSWERAAERKGWEEYLGCC